MIDFMTWSFTQVSTSKVFDEDKDSHKDINLNFILTYIYIYIYKMKMKFKNFYFGLLWLWYKGISTFVCYLMSNSFIYENRKRTVST